MEAQQTTKQESWFSRLTGNRYVRLVSNKYAIFIFRMLLGGIFLVSSLGKLVDIERYSVDVLYTFGVLPMVLNRPFGLVMPFIELGVALGLLFGLFTRLSALGSGLMSIAFFVVKAIVLAQGREIDCGCFGAVIETLASVTIYLDIPMMIFSFIIVFVPFNIRNWLAIGNRLSDNWKEKLKFVW